MCLFFLVSDGEHTSPEMALNIHLLPIEELPPSFQVTAPVLEVTPGGSTSVGESWDPKVTSEMALKMEPYFINSSLQTSDGD